jgi:hypothetical protein
MSFNAFDMLSQEDDDNDNVTEEVVSEEAVSETEVPTAKIDALKAELTELKSKFGVLVKIVRQLYEWSDDVDETISKLKKDVKFVEKMVGN